MPSLLNWSHTGFPQAVALQASLQHSSITWVPHCSSTYVETALHGTTWAAAPQASRLKMGSSPQAAASVDCSCGGSPLAVASFRLHPVLQHGLLHGCRWRSALCGIHGLQRDNLLLHGPFLLQGASSLALLLLCAWRTSYTPCALTLVKRGRILIFSTPSFPEATLFYLVLI